MKKEGCERPLSEAKVPERPLFSRVLSHKTMFFFDFPFMLNPWTQLPLIFCFFAFSDILFRMMGLLLFFSLYAPWGWLGIAVICALIEGLTFGLTTIWFALSAILMIFISLLHPPFYLQCLIFVLTALLLLLFTRPLALKYLYTKREKTNADNLIGKKALVIHPITEWEKGQVKINGAVWTATSINSMDIPEGSECIIEKIAGVTLFVRECNTTK